jgi:hypothetical protein
MSNRIFHILPNITNIPDFPDIISDDSLFDFFKFNTIEKESIEKFSKTGEGRLSGDKIKEFLNFDLKSKIGKENIDSIKTNIDNCLKKRGNKTRKIKAKKGGFIRRFTFKR